MRISISLLLFAATLLTLSSRGEAAISKPKPVVPLAIFKAQLHRADWRNQMANDRSVTQSKLTSLNATGARLKGLKVRGSKIIEAVFANADLRGGSWISSTFHNVNFSGANLAATYMYGSRFRNADFRGANLSGALLIGCDLRGSRFNSATTLPFSRDRAYRLGMVEVP